jgi:hypothetical protein
MASDIACSTCHQDCHRRTLIEQGAPDAAT